MFAHEAAVTRYLEGRFPDAGVTTIRSTPIRLAPDGNPVRDAAGGDQRSRAWTRAFASLAGMQIELIDATDELRALGCPVRSLAGLRDAIPGIAGDDELQLLGREGGLTDEQSMQLRSATVALQTACDELAALGIPMSLEHGDLHPGNIVVDGHTTGSSIGPIARYRIRSSRSSSSSKTPRARSNRRRRRAWRSETRIWPRWARIAPATALLRAFDLAQLLAPVAYAWMYQAQIQPGLEQQWEMNRMAPHYLRTALKRIAAPGAAARHD